MVCQRMSLKPWSRNLPDTQKSILFIGNFLTKKGNNPGVAEDLSSLLHKSGWQTLFSSSYRNKILRMLDMILTAIYRNSQYQVACIDIFSGQAFIFAEIMSFLFSIYKKPTIGTLHGGNLAKFEAQYPRRVRKMLRRLTVVCTPSLYLQEYFSKILPNIVLIPNGIDLDRFKYKPQKEPVPKLIWVRALHEIYTPTMAVEVIKILIDQYPNISLTMVGPDKGDGSFEKVQNSITQKGLRNNIRLVGGVPKNEVPTWLSQGDIFLNTTRIESFGVSVLEAAACGLCIVTTDAGELPYLWEDGMDVLIVPKNDANAMAVAVNRILTEPGLAEKLSRNARMKAENYDWSNVLPKWNKLLKEIIKNTYVKI